ncbi:PXA domain-containing protein [Pyronema domesticum]|uniref:Similar to Structural protein MDM1 acc. no. Q01846 n=1 Tax=Pyronema omphalodes (strain CBS 100304) TaxID=1076935 RepID=U4LEE1_PYROM|nr:PXA domain-containing protein [Pyronema domesticum]CCX13120.1 Similar to Structural protein MDM1; acc. no. Q01846 [Pyronema omphalodes CBS 100304]
MQQRQYLFLAFLGLLVLLNTVATTWLPSLRLIIWAFFAGCVVSLLLSVAAVLLTSTTTHVGDGDYNPLRNIKPLALATTAIWEQEVAAAAKEDVFERPPLYPPSFPISQALDQLLDNVNRDFINSWYTKVSPDPSFSLQVEKTIRHTLLSISQRLQTVDLPVLVVGRVVPLLTAHLHDFSVAEKTVRGNRLEVSLTESEELDLAIASKYRNGRLHAAAGLGSADMKEAQLDHLRKIIDKLLPLILPDSEKKSRVVCIIIREIVACSILFTTLSMLSDPDFWNRIIEQIGTATLQDRKTVRKLRAALDQHANPHSPTTRRHSKSQASTDPYHTQFIKLTPKDDERTFERFIRSIRLCNNLSDARRLRNDLTAQLKRDSKLEGVEGYGVYLRRLETGKRLVEQKVAHLSAGPSNRPLNHADRVMVRSQSENVLAKPSPTSRLESATLEEVMQDSSGLSYFMEHMDRKQRLTMVQFWLIVSGLRNPLEDDIPSSDEEEDTISAVATNFAPWKPSDRNDIMQIHEGYLSKGTLKLSDRPRRAIREFLKNGDKASQAQYVRARFAILRAQTAVYQDMLKNDFPGFRASDLWYKFLASGERSSSATLPKDQDPLLGTQATTPPLVRRGSGRHSFDDGRPKFDKEESYASDPLSASMHDIGSNNDDWNPQQALFGEEKDSLFGPEIPGTGTPESNIVEAMEAALNDIIEDKNRPQGRGSPLFGADSFLSEPPETSPRSSMDSPRPVLEQNFKKGPPSLASLGLVGGAHSDSVFKEELFPEDNPDLSEALDGDYLEIENHPHKDNSDDEIHQAAPGDLNLAEAIAALTYDIETRITQEAVIDSLYRKAELTNNTVELRILRKSKASLQREIRRKELQRQQYIIQESDNSLYGRSEVRISSTVTDKDQDGIHSKYLINVHRVGGEQLSAATWTIAKRFSEFHALHQELKRFDSVKELDFPSKVVLGLRKDFTEKRRVALEKYLQQLLLIPEVCRSREFRAFLSQKSSLPSSPTSNDGERTDLMSRLVSSVAGGMEDVLGNLPILDQLSLASANIIAAASSQLPPPPKMAGEGDASAIAEAEAELNAFDGKEEPFVRPICNLFLEVFELNKKTNWLRGRAVVVVLHQLLGGTIERKVREQTKSLLDEEMLLGYVNRVMEAVWPDGMLAKAGVPRTSREKGRTRTEAGVLLAALVPELSQSVVGKDNAKAAARRIGAICNNQRLNTSIVYTVFDEIIEEVFGVTV